MTRMAVATATRRSQQIATVILFGAPKGTLSRLGRFRCRCGRSDWVVGLAGQPAVDIGTEVLSNVVEAHERPPSLDASGGGQPCDDAALQVADPLPFPDLVSEAVVWSLPAAKLYRVILRRSDGLHRQGTAHRRAVARHMRQISASHVTSVESVTT